MFTITKKKKKNSHGISDPGYSFYAEPLGVRYDFYLSGPAKPAPGPTKPPVASNTAKPSAPPAEKKVASQVLSLRML